MNEIQPTPVEKRRFWAKVDIRGPDECRPWKAKARRNGYGAFRVGGRKGKALRAHRIAYFLENATWPENALHRCDRTLCCNPAHLFDGSQKDNPADAIAKNRLRLKGEDNAQAKLSENDVREIRALAQLKIGQRKIGEMFGVSQALVSKIERGLLWGHI